MPRRANDCRSGRYRSKIRCQITGGKSSAESCSVVPPRPAPITGQRAKMHSISTRAFNASPLTPSALFSKEPTASSSRAYHSTCSATGRTKKRARSVVTAPASAVTFHGVLYIFHRLTGLALDTAGSKIHRARHVAELAGDKQQVPNPYRIRKRPGFGRFRRWIQVFEIGLCRIRAERQAKDFF